MNTEFKQPTGSRTIVALVNNNFNYITCEYKIYMGKKLEASVLGYGMLLLHLNRKGFDTYDVEDAIMTMQKNFHDTAHFGIFGSLIFTSDSLDEETGVAS